MWDKITFPFPNFNGCPVDVWEWVSIFISHFSDRMITYSWRDKSQYTSIKWALDDLISGMNIIIIQSWSSSMYSHHANQVTKLYISVLGGYIYVQIQNKYKLIPIIPNHSSTCSVYVRDVKLLTSVPIDISNLRGHQYTQCWLIGMFLFRFFAHQLCLMRQNTPFNPLRACDAIWQHRSGPIFSQVLAFSLIAPSHNMKSVD